MDKYIVKESNDSKIEGIRYIGRFDFSDSNGPKFGWSGSTIVARFYGSKVTAKLKNIEGESYFTVVVDGEVVNDSLFISDKNEYTLLDGLTAGEHTVKLIKRTELTIGICQFLGFNFHGGKLLAPEYIADRRIEFIGDSISCGFGVEAEDENVEYNPKYDNAVKAYDMLTANILEAECHIIACSGHGITRNYGGDTVNTMPSKYNLVTQDTSITWDNKNWIPQVVVINLCTNDFAEGNIPNRNEFVAKYRDLVKKVHTNYVDAKIICTLGPVMKGDELLIAKDYIENGVVEALRNDGFEWISFLQYEIQKQEDGYGVSFHPSEKTHRIMAERLSNNIKAIMKW